MPANDGMTLEHLRRQFDGAEAQARKLVEGLSDLQLVWLPDPRRWSIALCLEHLNATGRWYLDTMEATLEKAPRTGETRPFRPGFLDGWFIRSLEPGGKLRFTAPRAVVPTLQGPPLEIMETFFALQDRYRRALMAAEGVDLKRIKFRSPLARFLKLPLGAGFALNAAHQRRHLHQAEKVKAEPGFPSSRDEQE